MTPEQIAATLDHCFGDYLYEGPAKHYPTPLPADLEQWYCYTIDQGHCVAIALESQYAPDKGPDQFLVPVPVKNVLRAGYTMRDGYVVCDFQYDPVIGVILPAGEEEW